jgi:segregation and condensation protein A
MRRKSAEDRSDVFARFGVACGAKDPPHASSTCLVSARRYPAQVEDTLTLDLGAWEGPLDLLLALARAQKVDLRQISILALTEQYLAYVERARALRLELAADYLVMAAWLAFLKSALLLPREPQADPDPAELALRLQLRLERLGAMRDAGARLMARDRIGRDVFLRSAPEGLRTVRQPRWHATIYDLLAAYGRVSARTRPVMHVVADREVMTLEAALDRVSALLGSRVDWATLETFLPPGSERLRKSALASSFLAALELAKRGQIELRQHDAFAPLYLKPVA